MTPVRSIQAGLMLRRPYISVAAQPGNVMVHMHTHTHTHTAHAHATPHGHLPHSYLSPWAFPSLMPHPLWVSPSLTSPPLGLSLTHTHHQGFTLVQGPPGTGKTSTILGILNAFHIREYNRYYQRAGAYSR